MMKKILNQNELDDIYAEIGRVLRKSNVDLVQLIKHDDYETCDKIKAAIRIYLMENSKLIGAAIDELPVDIYNKLMELNNEIFNGLIK
jgi:hypothetical protein